MRGGTLNSGEKPARAAGLEDAGLLGSGSFPALSLSPRQQSCPALQAALTPVWPQCRGSLPLRRSGMKSPGLAPKSVV